VPKADEGTPAQRLGHPFSWAQREHAAAIERGKKNITLATLKRLTDGLRVAMSDILRDI
jgi:hypothetical protein